MGEQLIMLKAGDYRYPTKMWEENGRLFFDFPYNPQLKDEIKMMAGHKWHGFDPNPRKLWSVKNCQRNLFQLEYLQGKNPYARYDAKLDTSWVPTERYHIAK